MSAMSVDVIIPIVRWRREMNSLCDRPLDVIRELDGVVLSSKSSWIEQMEFSWSVSLIKPSRALRNTLDSQSAPMWGYDFCARFRFVSEYPGARTARKYMGYPETNIPPKQLWRSVFLDTVKVELFAFQVAANLANTGSELFSFGIMKSKHWVTTYKGPYAHNWELYHHIGGGLEGAPAVPFLQVWRWLQKANGFRAGVSDTPASKSLAALTYLYDGNTVRGRLSSLIWACAGLEAFYGDGGSGRHAQLVQRIPAFLPHIPPAKCKEDMALVYKVRSSIIHGNRGISSAVAGSDAIPDKHFDEESSAAWLSSFYLFETLRQCASMGISTANFRVVFNSDL